MLNKWCVSLVRIVVFTATTLVAFSASTQLLNISSYTTDDGLAASQVWRVHQDSRGYMWFATSGGISRYDGVSFTSFTAGDGIAAGLTRTIVEDPRGCLWFGTSAGATRFDGRSFVHFDRHDGLGRGVVWASTLDPHGHVWFGTQEGGASVVVDDAIRTFSTAEGLAEDYVYALHADRAGRLWIGHRSAGLTRCDIDVNGGLSECRHFGTADGLPHDSVRAIVEARDGTMYIGTRGGGVASFDGQRFTTSSTVDGLVGNDVYALLIRQEGKLVIATVEDGVSICEIPGFESCQVVNKHNGLLVDNVISVFEDREENLWFGLNTGVSKLASERFESLTDTEGLPTTRVNSVHIDDNDDVWIGTSAGLARVRCGPDGRRPYDVRAFTSADGLPANSVWDALRDHRGSLWVGTGGGLCRLSEEGRCETMVVDGRALTAYILDLFSDSRGDLWLGTNRGLTRVQWPANSGLPRSTNYTVADGLAAGNVYAISEDRFGRIWVGTIGYGLSVFDGSSFSNYTVPTTLLSNEISALCPASDGSMWIGSTGGGLVKAQLGAADQEPVFERFGSVRGLDMVVVRSVFEDDRGLLWLGTSQGILQVDPTVAGGQDAVVRRFDTASGLVGKEVVTGNAIAADRYGALWFGFSEGVSRYLAHLDTSPPVPPPTTIEKVITGSGVTVLAPFSVSTPESSIEPSWIDGSILELPFNDNNLRFEYRGLLFASEREVHYQIQLQGFDDQWSPPTSEPYKDYTNLNPGRYTFMVRACSRNGQWESEAVSFAVLIRPPSWQTWWFLTLGAAVFCLALVAGHRARLRQIRIRARELEAMVAERTDELNQYSLALRDHAHQLQQANTRIQEADRHKSDFLANMSHELRTPMNAIIGFSEVLVDKLDGQINARFLGFLDNIRSSGHHLLGLINNLLDLSKIEAGKMELSLEEAHLADIVGEVRSVVSGVAHKRGIEIVVQLVGELPALRIDVPKVKQILYNLLSNAVNFSHDGTKVVVGATIPPSVRSELAVDSFELAVADQGVGIDIEEQESIFEEFFQVGEKPTSVQRGTGLGLAIVRHFVDLMGGKLSVESAPNQGATFRVELPVDMSGGTPSR